MKLYVGHSQMIKGRHAAISQFQHIAYVMGGRVGIDDTHCVHLET